MKFSNRTIIIYVILILTMGNLSLAQDEREVKTITISGTVGLGGVTMQGLPGNIVTDSNGYYSVNVDIGWTGTVKPVKRGYVFRPASMTYHDVNIHHNEQNYVPEIMTFTISGNAGVSGVELQGLPGNPVTDEQGNYSFKIQFGWAGTVIPVKEGYTFRPPQKSYYEVTERLNNQNYDAEAISLTISGEVICDDKVLSGVILKGLPGEPITGLDGKYNVKVKYGWSGLVIPEKEGYHFSPYQMEYTRLTRDKMNNRYIAKPKMLTISGTIEIAGKPITGVLFKANNGGGSSITDAQGRYSIEVPYMWTGEIFPSKQGLVFDPPSTSYKNVTENFYQGQPVSQQNESYQDNFRYRGLPKPSQAQTVVERVNDRKVVVIPASDTQAGEFDVTIEDMRVMLQILDEKLISEPRTIRGVLMDYGEFFGSENQSSRAVYIQDYGVLFLMEVDFPLLFGPELRQEPEHTADESTDPVWQQARQKVLSPNTNATGNLPESRTETIQERVERLKTDLIQAMKHVSNIRQLKPVEWIIFNVTGINQLSGRTGRSGMYTRGGIYGEGGYGGYSGGNSPLGGYAGGHGRMGGYISMSGGAAVGGMGGYGDMDFSSSTVLTIRAKKSDVDAFAKGELDVEQFRQKINIFVY